MANPLPIPISSIPSLPGVYQFKNQEGKVIYIGKAKNLKNRVSSYFVKSYSKSGKINRLVSQIRDVDFSVVKNETDALLLENNLIKEHQPRYNALLKDGKSFSGPKSTIPRKRSPSASASSLSTGFHCEYVRDSFIAKTPEAF